MSTASPCRRKDTFGAMEETPRKVHTNTEVLAPGVVPDETVVAGFATPIATGGMLPRGADAVLMVEHSELVRVRCGPDNGNQAPTLAR